MVTLGVNGEPAELDADPGTTLLTALRRHGHHEVRAGCRTGDCGACTVLVGGEPALACLTPVFRCQGHEVTTVAGLAAADGPSPVQRAFADHAGFQCGFCTAGMMLATSAQPDRTPCGLRRGLKGNLCRCTGYRAIVDAAAAIGDAPTTPAGPGVGESMPAPATQRLLTGREPFTLDLALDGVGHIALLQSPHASAVVRSMDVSAALAVPGVRAVLTADDSPRTLYSSGRHTDREIDPDDQLLFDRVVRHEGQRIAAVVADTAEIAERAGALVVVDYELRAAVLTPATALAPGAPLVHGDKGPDSRIDDVSRNVVAAAAHERGTVAEGLAEADVVVSGTWSTPRSQHVHLEPHSAVGWPAEDGSITLRSSTQVPHLTRDELCRVFGLPASGLRVLAARVGGGFGAKQELVVEDVVLAAVLATGRSAVLELTREQQFTMAPCRHPAEVSVTLGARADGTLTAIDLDVTLDAGAHGNHSRPVLRHGLADATAPYRCENVAVSGRAAYTNNVPSGAFRGYGLGQVVLAVECAMDELADALGMSPVAVRRVNAVAVGDVPGGLGSGHLLTAGNTGLEECLDLATAGLAETRDRDAARDLVAEHPQLGGTADDWAVGEGLATTMSGTTPGRGHRAQAVARLTGDGFELDVGTVEMGSGATTVQLQIASTVLGVPTDRVHLRQADTSLLELDSGTFGSTGVMVAGRATAVAVSALRTRVIGAAAVLLDVPPSGCRLSDDGLAVVDPDSARHVTLDAVRRGSPEPLVGHADEWMLPSSMVANVQAFRVAVHRPTGCLVVLDSVHAADAGTVINPAQLRGQIEGAVVQALGAAMSEELVTDAAGVMLTRDLRGYRIPQLGDVPAPRVRMAGTSDPAGPFGAKSMAEAPYNPVAPALVNAVRAALGRAPRRVPLTPARLHGLTGK